jgi:hypothetical protein
MDTPVLITYSNYGYIDFAKNLILNLANILKHHKLHFYCLDKQTYDELSKYTYDFLTVELFEQDVSSKFESYNTSEYKKLTHTKTSVLRAAFRHYPFIHFIDCDVVCLKEPSVDHYIPYKNFDIVFQSDFAYKYKSTECKNRYSLDYQQCTGNMSMRRTEGSMTVIILLEEKQAIRPGSHDQECLHKIFEQHRVFDIRGFRHAKLSVYPPEEYTNGSWKDSVDNTYFFHANHVVGKEHKIELLKNVNMWLVLDEQTGKSDVQEETVAKDSTIS